MFLIFNKLTKSDKSDITSPITASIYYDYSTQKYNIVPFVLDTNAVAYATYTPTLYTDGWDKLAITTNNKFEDNISAYAAGYLEGVLTNKHIHNHFLNVSADMWKETGKMPDNVREFFVKHREYINNQYLLNKNDNYWKIAFAFQTQLEGLIQGYNDEAAKNSLPTIDSIDFHNMASSGDIMDIIYYKNKEGRPNYSKMTYTEILKHIRRSNHCSALIKISADFKDLWFGHNTWWRYSSMTRIFKEYNFNFKDIIAKTNSVMFSSYPAAINSVDDFYVTNTDLAIMETTNSFFNNDLFDLLTPDSLLTWHRAMIANYLTNDSKSWTETFIINNSGTYNNQFMVLDLKLVDTEKQKVHDNALWIVEQIPGQTQSGDVTQMLRYGYWPSFNTPFFDNIKKLSLIPDTIDRDPMLIHTLDYDTCARAEIFRRDEGKVTSLEEFKKLMRSNDYKHDYLSLNDPSFTISAREELDSEKGDCEGAIDAKVASIHDIRGKANKSVSIVQGPTYGDVPIFHWEESKFCKNTIRFGLSDRYAFEWIVYESGNNKGVDMLKFLN